MKLSNFKFKLPEELIATHPRFYIEKQEKSNICYLKTF